MGKVVKPGDTVDIHYVGKLSDDSVFDSTAERGPFQFEAGGDTVIPGMAAGVIGMAVGEKKSLTIGPDQAYGDPDPQLVIQVPSDRLPEGVEVGDVLGSDQTEGVTWMVREVGEQESTLDANHPLAGQTLHFDVELVSIQS